MTPPLTDIDGRPVLLPYPHDGNSTRYWKGCRCDSCRANHARIVRDRRRRRAEGRSSGFDRLPLAPTVALLEEMHDLGLTWERVADACAITTRDVRRLRRGTDTFVSRKVAERIQDGHRSVTARSDPASDGAYYADGEYARWMVFSMMARGWPSSMIAEASGASLGFLYHPNHRMVTSQTSNRVAAVFGRIGDTWGPNRLTAVRTWRSGRFPSDCYEWDMPVPDLRPIPGSLHPDLVVEAATFPSRRTGGRERVLKSLAAVGQWPTERCARTSFARWADLVGVEADTDGPMCQRRIHDHSPPEAWRSASVRG